MLQQDECQNQGVNVGTAHVRGFWSDLCQIIQSENRVLVPTSLKQQKLPTRFGVSQARPAVVGLHLTRPSHTKAACFG